MYEGCPNCTRPDSISNLVVQYDYEAIKKNLSKASLAVRNPAEGIWRYSELLPVKADTSRVSLGEGCTPLHRATKIGEEIGLKNLFLKDESRNPTWSFKDRYCSVALSLALELKAKVVVSASTGNLGASAAAYSAKAGLPCVIFTLPGIPAPMKTLMFAYGAKLIPVKTSEGRWSLMARCVKELGWYPVGTYTLPSPTGNPFGVQGYKTIGYEIIEQLGWRSPDFIILPTAYGEGLYGTWRGVNEFRLLGLVDELPRMIAAEPEASGPVSRSLEAGADSLTKVSPKQSIAFSITAAVTSYQAIRAVTDSSGKAVLCSDAEMLEAQHLLAAKEGVFVEVSSASSLAAARILREEGYLGSSDIVVCVLTSSGLKHPSTIPEMDLPVIEPYWSQFLDVLKGIYGICA
jgi:threonine synthase